MLESQTPYIETFFGLTNLFGEVMPESHTSYIISRLLSPDILVFFIPIIAIIMGVLLGIVKVVVKHRERMAKIEQGIDPDEKKVGK